MHFVAHQKGVCALDTIFIQAHALYTICSSKGKLSKCQVVGNVAIVPCKTQSPTIAIIKNMMSELQNQIQIIQFNYSNIVRICGNPGGD